MLQCNFESGLCNLEQELDDDLDWTRISGSTPSQYTGPSDGQGGFGWYIFLEATDHQQGDTARYGIEVLHSSHLVRKGVTCRVHS